MKRGKKLTRAQKIFISNFRFNVLNWLCVQETKDTLVIIHKNTNTIRKLKK